MGGGVERGAQGSMCGSGGFTCVNSLCLYKGFIVRNLTQPPLGSDPEKEDVCLHQPRSRSRTVGGYLCHSDYSLWFRMWAILEANCGSGDEAH